MASATGQPEIPNITHQSEGAVHDYNPLPSKSYMPNEFFQFHQNPRYDADRHLYSDLMAEGFNIYGTPMMYYAITYDTTYDPLFGEDSLRRISRKFPIKAMYELPPEEELYQKFGIEGLDNFEMHVSKKHFGEASKYDTSGVELFPSQYNQGKENAYSEYTPKAGDILRAEYNNTYYEIVEVHEEEQMFLQGKHAWKFRVRVFRDEKFTYTSATSAAMTEISAVNDVDDILKANEYVDTVSADVLYEPESTEESSQQDDLGGWFD
jgi:hypothetical protein